MKKQFIFFNPSSGSYSKKEAERILSLLKAAGVSAEALSPENEEKAIAAVSCLSLEHDNPTLIAAGGDGTFNTLLNGIKDKKATLAVIPLGTANVIGYELGIRSVEDAVMRISRGDKKPLNAAMISCGQLKKRFFLMAGIGFDGAVVCGVRNSEKTRFGKLAYIISALRELKRYDSSSLILQYGDKTVEAHSVIITNSRHYGGKFIISPESSIHEPSLEVIPLKTYSRSSLLKVCISLILTGRFRHFDNSFIMKSGVLTVSGTKHCQIDGDSFLRADFTVSIEEMFAEVII